MDAFTSFNGKAFVMIECKTTGTFKRDGQIRAMEDYATAAGQAAPTFLLIAEHDYTEEDVDLGPCHLHSIVGVLPCNGFPERWVASEQDFPDLTVNDFLAALAFVVKVPFKDRLGADVPTILSHPESPFEIMDGLRELKLASAT